MRNKDYIVSPVSFDLGAINTGIFMAHYSPLETENGNIRFGTDIDSQGALLKIDPKKITLGRKKRTARRHTTRGYKRRKMAKRLLWRIVEDVYGLKDFTKSRTRESDDFMDAVNGLLNRRGYSFLVSESEYELPDARSLYDEGFDFLDPEKPVKFQTEELIKYGEEFFLKYWEKDFLKEKQCYAKNNPEIGINPQDIKNDQKILKEFIEALFRDAGGHKKRAQYLDDIETDIKAEWNTRFKPLTDKISAAEFARITGHISNLQLRCLRKYFNDPEWTVANGGAKWDSKRLYDKFRRYVIGWRQSDEEEKSRKIAVLEVLNKHREDQDILAVWKELDPILTIPPYEDQDNRNPPKCTSLILNHETLNKVYGDEWKTWATRMDADGSFLSAFAVSGLEGDLLEARKLQFTFDRSTRTDCLNLRKILRDRKHQHEDHSNKSTEDDHTLLARIPQPDNFLEAADWYYEECEQAARSEWYAFNEKPEASDIAIGNFRDRFRILRECGCNPPHKDKVANIVVGHLLGIKLSCNELKEFDANFFSDSKNKVSGNLTFKGLCKSISEKKKGEYDFKILWNNAKNANSVQQGTKEDKDLRKMCENAQKAADKLTDYLKTKWPERIPEKTERYSDPFILSQIYDILCEEGKGFHKNCRICAEDNSIRSSYYNKETGVSFAKRLPKNTGIPFDGMVARLVQRLARDAARLKADQICRHLKNISPEKCPSLILIPAIIEENRFEFASEYGEIRKSQDYNEPKKRKKQIESQIKKQPLEWEDKNSRIKALKICPYCGKQVSDQDGQIDHIVPRAYSKKKFGTVFNSEHNLIYCHSTCNHRKGDIEYRLEDLSEKYLEEVFNTSDTGRIRSEIENFFAEFSSGKIRAKILGFSKLDENERAYIRHALFLDHMSTARCAVEKELNQLNRTFVNGTQRWFIREFSKFLRNNLKSQINNEITIEVRSDAVDAEVTQSVRNIMARANPNIKKPQEGEQPAFSHIVDATSAFFAWMHENGQLGFRKTGEQLDFSKWLCSLLPTSYEVMHISRTQTYNKQHPNSVSLFKDSIYGDSFLSLIIGKDGKLSVGFSPKNSAPVNEKKSKIFYERLKPFLRQEKHPLPDSIEEIKREVLNSGKPRIIPIHSDKARDFLNKIAHESLDLDLIDTAKILNALHYATIKTEIIDEFCEQKKLSNKEYVKDKINKKCKINVQIPGYTSQENLLFLPCKNDWLSILDRIPSNIWNGGTYENIQNTLADIYDDLFRNNNKLTVNRRKHTRTRKGHSLPIVCAPSGGFRIRRVTPRGNVWQTVAAEIAYKGFYKDENGNIDYNKGVYIDPLTSKNIHGLKSVYRKSEEFAVIRMDEWRKISLTEQMKKNGITELFIAPGTEPRPSVRMVVDEKFLCPESQDSTNAFFETVKPSLKIDPKYLFPKDLKPRNKSSLRIRRVQRISDHCIVEFEYTIDRRNSELKNWYNQGQPIA